MNPSPRSTFAAGSVILVALVATLSLAACATAAPSPTAPPSEPTESPAVEPVTRGLMLLAGDRRLDPGGCTELEWTAKDYVKVYLDGRGVEAIGTVEVCPTETTTYVLAAVREDGGEETRDVVIEVTASVEPTDEPTDVPPPANTAVPVTKAPEATATPTAEPTAEVSVEFYPDNGVYELPRDQKCTAVNWKTTGVTDVQLEREGMGRTGVGPAGREEVCFDGRLKYFLFYKLPTGAEERQEMELRHSN